MNNSVFQGVKTALTPLHSTTLACQKAKPKGVLTDHIFSEHIAGKHLTLIPDQVTSIIHLINHNYHLPNRHGT